MTIDLIQRDVCGTSMVSNNAGISILGQGILPFPAADHI